MNCTTTDDKLRETTQRAFSKRGDQSAAAAALGVSKQYVWQVLNGECKNEEMLLKLSNFILKRIAERQEREVQKKALTTRLTAALAL